MFNFKTIAPAVALSVAASQACAQNEGWQFAATGYLFASETRLNVDGTETTLSFSDALENLEFGAMATFVAANGPWTFIVDFMHFDLLFENETPGPAFSQLDTDTDMTVFHAGGFYRVHETPGVALSVGGGFRYFETNTTVTLSPGLLPGQSVSEDDSWIDPVVAVLGEFEFSERWRSTVWADYGGFFSNRETNQITVTFDYAFSENWVGRVGYRYLKVDNSDDDFRAELYGPVLGVTYRF